MMNKKTFFWNLGMMIFVIMGIFLFACGAWAEISVSISTGNSIFDDAYQKLYTTFTQARVVVYILSGFGLIGFSIGAIFGKISFRWLAMIAIALFMLAAADKIINYIVAAGSNTGGILSDPHYAGDSDFNLNGVDNSFDLRFEDLL